MAVESRGGVTMEEPVPVPKVIMLALLALAGMFLAAGFFVIFVWVIDLNAVDHKSDPEFRSFAIILTLAYLGVATWFLRAVWRHFK
jgi:hypothetical protein